MTSDTISALAAVGQLAVAVALVVVTLRYVRLTRDLVEETKRARRPIICLELDFKGDEVLLRVSNRGSDAAMDVSFTIEKDFSFPPELRNTYLRELKPLVHGYPYLAPGSEYRYRIGYARRCYTDQLEAQVQITYFATDPQQKAPFAQRIHLSGYPLDRAKAS